MIITSFPFALILGIFTIICNANDELSICDEFSTFSSMGALTIINHQNTTKSTVSTTLPSTTTNILANSTAHDEADSTPSSGAYVTLSPEINISSSATTTTKITTAAPKTNNYIAKLTDTSISTKSNNPLSTTSITTPASETSKILPTQPSSTTASEMSNIGLSTQADSTSSTDINDISYMLISTALTPNTTQSTKSTSNTSPSTRSTSNAVSSTNSTSTTTSTTESTINTSQSTGSTLSITLSTKSISSTSPTTESTSNNPPSTNSTSNTTPSIISTSSNPPSTISTTNTVPSTIASSTESSTNTASQTESSSNTLPLANTTLNISTSNAFLSTESSSNAFLSTESTLSTTPSTGSTIITSTSIESTTNTPPFTESTSSTPSSTVSTTSSAQSTRSSLTTVTSTGSISTSSSTSTITPTETSDTRRSTKSTSNTALSTEQNTAASQISYVSISTDKTSVSIDEILFTPAAAPITVLTQSRLRPSTEASSSSTTETNTALTRGINSNKSEEINSVKTLESKPTLEVAAISTSEDRDNIKEFKFQSQSLSKSFENGSGSLNFAPLMRRRRSLNSIINESAFTESEVTKRKSASSNSNVKTEASFRTDIRTFLENGINLEEFRQGKEDQRGRRQEQDERGEKGQKEDKQEEIKFIKFSNGPYYSPGKHHEIIIDFGANSVKDLKLQVTDSDSEAVGDFVHLPSGSKAISCKGRLMKNTFVRRKFSYSLSSLTIIWRAPMREYAPKTLMYRALFNTTKKEFGNLSRIDNIPPYATSDCGKRNVSLSNMETKTKTLADVSCFRACPVDASDCTFSQSIFGVKIIKNADGKLDITLGANTGNDYNYVAIGQTENNKTLKNSDINICYKNIIAGSSIRLVHKFLLHLNHSLLNHEGDISLISAFMDNGSLWCRFKRPFRGGHVSRMNVDKPLYFFFFIGRYINGEFILPNLNQMMITSDRKALKDGLFGNEKIILLQENEAQKLCQSNFIIVTVLIVFFLY